MSEKLEERANQIVDRFKARTEHNELNFAGLRERISAELRAVRKEALEEAARKWVEHGNPNETLQRMVHEGIVIAKNKDEKIAALEAELKEEKAAHYADLIGQEHLLGTRIEQLEKHLADAEAENTRLCQALVKIIGHGVECERCEAVTMAHRALVEAQDPEGWFGGEK